MKPKNVLAILGSPHSNGVIAALLEYSIREAEKAGYNITKINLYEKQLAFCTGCRVCLTSGKCVQNDDIQEIVSLLHESQIVILAAPTYWANVPAPVKNLFDCLQYASAVFVDIWTEQGGITEHGRIFQNRWNEVNGESSLCQHW